MKSARVLLAIGSVLLLAFGLRLGGAWYWQMGRPADSPFAFPDSDSYWQLGRSLARGEPYAYGEPGARIFRAPGYPLLLASLFVLWPEGPPPLAARVLGAGCGTAAVGLLMLAAYRLGGVGWSLATGGLAAVQPECIGGSVFVLSEAPFAPWLAAQLWLTCEALRAESAPRRGIWALLAGCAAGVGTLIRPSWLLFLPTWGAAWLVGLLLAHGWASYGRRGDVGSWSEGRESRSWGVPYGSAVRLLGAMLFGFTAVMAPWWIRNYEVAGRFVPTTLQVGASLYDGFNPEADGGSDMRFVARFKRELAAEHGGELPADWEWRLDSAMRRAAIAWGSEHPGEVLRLAGAKFARMWRPWPNAREFRAPAFGLLLAAGYLPLLVLAAMGVWRLQSRPEVLLVWLGPLVYLALMHAVFVGSIRYRQPAVLALTLVAAAGIPRMPLASGETSRTAT